MTFVKVMREIKLCNLKFINWQQPLKYYYCNIILIFRDSESVECIKTKENKIITTNYFLILGDIF